MNDPFSVHQSASVPHEEAGRATGKWRQILLTSVALAALAGVALVGWLSSEHTDSAAQDPPGAAPPLPTPIPPADGLPPPPSFRAADDLALDHAAVALGGQVAAWVGKERALYLLWPAGGRRVRLLVGAAPDELTCLALSPDGRLLAAAMSDRTIRVWDVHAAAELGRLPAARVRVVSASFSPDGRLLFTCTQDAEVTIWDLGGPWLQPGLPR